MNITSGKKLKIVQIGIIVLAVFGYAAAALGFVPVASFVPKDSFELWRWEIAVGVIALPLLLVATFGGIQRVVAWISRHIRIGPIL